MYKKGVKYIFTCSNVFQKYIYFGIFLFYFENIFKKF